MSESSPTRLPSELILLVIEEVKSQADLYRLSLVSRQVNFWAERALYNHLLITRPGELHSFITLAKSPHRALQVRHVNITTNLQSRSEPIPFIEPALLLLENLTSLTIYVVSWFPFIPEIAFRLRSFVYLGCYIPVQQETIRNLISFFVQAVNLERLELCRRIFYWNYILPPQALPKLTTLSALVEDVPGILLARPVTHLASVYRRGHFSVDRIEGPSELSSLWIPDASWLPCYGEYFPSLKLLQFMKSNEIIRYLQGVPILEKIKVSGLKSTRKWSATDATEIFAACPSLKRIELRKNIERQEGEVWIRGVDKPLCTRWVEDEWMYT